MGREGPCEGESGTWLPPPGGEVRGGRVSVNSIPEVFYGLTSVIIVYCFSVSENWFNWGVGLEVRIPFATGR